MNRPAPTRTVEPTRTFEATRTDMTPPPLPDASSARFSMLLPEAWETLDFDPVTRDRSIQQMVRRAVGKADSLALVRRWAVDTYRQMFDHAASTGMFFGANFASEIAGRPLSASVLAFVTRTPIDEHGRSMEPVTIAEGLRHPDEDERPVEPPRLVELPVGSSVRTRARVSVREYDGAGKEPEVDVVRFFTPVPEWDLLLVIAFSTPILAAAGAFAELFDSMAATAQWKS